MYNYFLKIKNKKVSIIFLLIINFMKTNINKFKKIHLH